MVIKTALPPKRQRVINAITESIIQGQLPPGDRLATVRKMSDHFEVSPSVIHRALKNLVDDGMIECRGAQGFYVKEQNYPREKPEPPAGMPAPGNGRIFLSIGHHSDLVWKYDFRGYEKIREKQFERLLYFLKKYENCHVFIEQAEVLRVYLKSHPDSLPEFRRACEEGRLALTGGNSIPDLNLCCGESLVRNLQEGRKFYGDTFGFDVTIACENDAFGMCAQLSQVLAKAGYSFLLPGRLPGFPQDIPRKAPFRWRGLDGTEITVVPTTMHVVHQGYDINLPVTMNSSELLRETVSALRNRDGFGDIFAQYMTEATEIKEDLFFEVEAANRQEGLRKVEFGSVYEYCSRINKNQLPVVNGEFNPTFSGCYTTRSGVKQGVRLAENKLFAAEMLQAITGIKADFTGAWRQLSLASFHDGVCGCHSDAANLDIMKKLDSVYDQADKELGRCGNLWQGGFVVFNPSATEGNQIFEFASETDYEIEGCDIQRTGGKLVCLGKLPGCGIASFAAGKASLPPAKAKSPKFSTECFDVDFSTPFPVIQRRGLNRQVCGREHFGEIIFRRDTGSMWSEEIQSPWHGVSNQKETVESIAGGAVFTEVATRGEVLPFASADEETDNYWAGLGKIEFRKEYRFYHKLDYFTMKVTLDWTGNNTKIAIRFPLNLDMENSQMLCDIPFGAIARQPYFEVPRRYSQRMKRLNPEDYRHVTGDWPVLHWVDCADTEAGLVVANNGIPGWQWNAGMLTASLLRSGTKIADGSMLPESGAWDNGIHEYEFAFRPHSPFEMEAAPALGRILNRKPVVFPGTGKQLFPEKSGLRITAGNIAVSSLRRVEDGLILRVYETLGRKTVTALASDLGTFELFESDLTERKWHKCDDPGKLKFDPMEIKTYKLVF